MMKKNSTKGYIILGILFALVSIFAFAVPTIKTATFWIAYVFTAVAFVAQIFIWKTALEKQISWFSGFIHCHCICNHSDGCICSIPVCTGISGMERNRGVSCYCRCFCDMYDYC